MTDATSDRCPGCGSFVRAGSPWCTLCFTDLRAAVPAAAAAPATPAASGAVAVAAADPSSSVGFDVFDPLTAPLAVLERTIGAPVVGAADGPAAVVTAAPAPATASAVAPALTESAALPSSAPEQAAAAACWPCFRCGTQVALAESACNACGSPFMAAAQQPADVVERYLKGGIEKKTQYLIMVGGTVAIVLLGLCVSYLLGTIF